MDAEPAPEVPDHDDADEAHVAGPDDEGPRPPRGHKVGGSVLAASMLGLGEVIEPNKTKVEIEQVAEDEPDDLPFKIDFGELPGLS